MRPARFVIGDAPREGEADATPNAWDVRGWDDGFRWNGWAVPIISDETLVAHATAVNPFDPAYQYVRVPAVTTCGPDADACAARWFYVIDGGTPDEHRQELDVGATPDGRTGYRLPDGLVWDSDADE